jgi:hypothetical protein
VFLIFAKLLKKDILMAQNNVDNDLQKLYNWLAVQPNLKVKTGKIIRRAIDSVNGALAPVI